MTVFANGVDFAYGEGVTVAQLKAAGVEFVCRYLSGGSSKDITATELDSYLTGGINVVLNWETGGTMNSEAQGVSDAQGAAAEVNRLASAVSAYSAAILAAPIIFSADFDPTSGTIAGILAYMTGVQSVLGKARTGIYGGVAALNAVGEAGIGSYYWQTTAWSGSEVSSYAQLYQYAYNFDIGPAETDKDEALAANYGYIGSSVTPPTEVPGAVTGLQVTATTDTTVTIEWTATPHATSYNVGYDQGSDWHGSVDTNSIEFTGLDDTVTYTFTVSAEPNTDGGVSSVAQQPGQAIGPPPPPPPEPHWDTSPLVEEGDTGVVVEVVQYLLNQSGASLTVDGDFGSATLAAVEAFQVANDVGDTGEVHGYTWPVLAVQVENGSDNDAVKAVQVALNAADNAGLTVDGNDGPATTAAVEAFQTKSGLTANGVVDVADAGTFNALVNAALSDPPAPTPPTPAPPTPVAGSAQENANYLAKFLTANGYTNMGAAGIITCCYGESELNPESVGDGGNGLIGWTPPLKGAVTGNASADLEFQAKAILTYNNNNDKAHIAELNAQTSVQAAADYYSQVFERPAVTDSDVHAQGITIAEAAIASL